MRVRYRILTSKRDPQAIADVRASWDQEREASRVPPLLMTLRDGHRSGLHDPADGLFASLEAPRAVETQEGSGSLQTVQQLVRSGTLKPTDLVDLGKGWSTVEECPALLDAVDAYEGSRRVPKALLFLGVAALTVMLAWLLAHA